MEPSPLPGAAVSPAETPAPKTASAHLGAAALLMTTAVLLSRVLGFGREAFIAYAFGANGRTDAFYDAFTMPDWLNYLVAGGTLSITFLPVYARYLAEDRAEEADRVFSVIITVMGTLVLGGIALGEFFAPEIIARFFHRLRPEEIADCIRYTRILFPAQIFFYLGGVISATLYARKRFFAPAVAPLLYNVGIIAVGWAGRSTLGADGLAWGALAGAFCGPFLLPLLAASQLGLRYRPTFAARHPGFREWLALSLPLMIGVSLVTADDWIIRYFAGAALGATTKLNYAKRLVSVPIAVAGQAVGQASMPFFAQLFAERRRQDLGELLGRTVRAVLLVCLLGAAWMAALRVPLTDLLLRRGSFSRANVPDTAAFLSVFALAIPFWGIQGLYARAWYAARNTLWPMLAGTAVTVAIIPAYGFLFARFGPTGLAWGSNLGIALNTLVLVALLPRILPEHRRGPIVRSGLKQAALAGAGFLAAWAAVRPLHAAMLTHGSDLARIAAGSVAFGLVVALGAKVLGIEEAGLLVQRISRRFARGRG